MNEDVHLKGIRRKHSPTKATGIGIFHKQIVRADGYNVLVLLKSITKE